MKDKMTKAEAGSIGGRIGGRISKGGGRPSVWESSQEKNKHFNNLRRGKVCDCRICKKA